MGESETRGILIGKDAVCANGGGKVVTVDGGKVQLKMEWSIKGGPCQWHPVDQVYLCASPIVIYRLTQPVTDWDGHWGQNFTSSVSSVRSWREARVLLRAAVGNEVIIAINSETRRVEISDRRGLTNGHQYLMVSPVLDRVTIGQTFRFYERVGWAVRAVCRFEPRSNRYVQLIDLGKSRLMPLSKMVEEHNARVIKKLQKR